MGFGLVGGLLHSLHTQAPLTVPERMTAAGILAAVAADDRPTTVIGVPFHAELLAGVQLYMTAPLLTRSKGVRKPPWPEEAAA